MSSVENLLKRAHLVKLKVEPPPKRVRSLPYVVYDSETGEPRAEYKEAHERYERLGLSYKVYVDLEEDLEGSEP